MNPVRFGIVSAGIFTTGSIIYIVAFFWCWAQPVTAHDPLVETYLVKRFFAVKATSPRWLIVGGSSAWFGFNSETLARATGQPVTNLGVHAEIPLWFQLREAEALARPGDTVLLAAELVHYWRKKPTTYGASKLGVLAPDLLADASWAERSELFAAIPPSHIVARLIAKIFRNASLVPPSTEELVFKLRRRWEGTQTAPVPSYYSYLELNAYGDFARVRLRERHQSDDYGLNEQHELAVRVWSQLAASSRRLQAKGVNCLFTWPPFERPLVVNLEPGILSTNLCVLRERLQLSGWRQVGSVEDAILDSEFFYDTAYHLTSEGALERTRRFVQAARDEGILSKEEKIARSGRP